MCRNIRKLRRPDGTPTDAELRDAALQFVRKVSGYQKPSKVNEAVFGRAVDEVMRAQRRLFDGLVIPVRVEAAGASPRRCAGR
jgi:hypothetical protein